MLAEGVSREYLIHHRVCPKAFAEDGSLVVATSPGALLDDAVEDLRTAYACEIIAEVATEHEVDVLIERLTSRVERELDLRLVPAEYDPLAADVRMLAAQPPVVRYVNLLIRDAYEAGASDIHLEATGEGLSARFRLDGVLSAAASPPQEHGQAVISRIKLLAELDVAERRKPQDGRIRVRLEARELDVRVSTIPTMHGESVVLRLLERGGRPVALEELGMHPDTLSLMASLAIRPHGMLLVTGPTGSGKTTTLYAAIGKRDPLVEKIITLEDPVEYRLANITQVPVHRQAGVTFASALRSILRHDPDVLMIGEMRDTETADIAVQAAMTGHLVYSTLHTNDAIGAIPRLIDLGVPEYLIASTLEGILAQRLVRRVCADCGAPDDVDAERAGLLVGHIVRPTRGRRGSGCAHCRGTGYRGRIGIYELLVISDELRDAITRREDRAELKRKAFGQDHVSMQEDGWRKVQAGITTVEEVLRVVQA